MGNMKYVKLFESWLNEEEGQEQGQEKEVTSFDRTESRKWPVLKTTPQQLYSDKNGQIDTAVLDSLLGRAKQEQRLMKKDGKVMTDAEGNKLFDTRFNSYAKIGLDWVTSLRFPHDIDKEGTITSSNNRRGGFKIDVDGYDKRWSFKNKYRYEEANEDGEDIPKDKQPEFALFAIQSDVEIERVSMSDTDGFSKFERTTYGKALIILPKKISGFKTTPKDLMTMPVIVSQNQSGRMTTFGQLLVFIKDGMGDMGLLKEPAKDELAKIFQGETAAKRESSLATTPFDMTRPGGKSFNFEPAARTKNFTQDQVKDNITISTTKGTVMIGQLKFEYNKAQITEDSKTVLNDPMLENAILKAKKSIEIVGHTDGKGGDGPGNQKLSKDRAESIKAYLETTDWWKEDVAPKKGLKITAVGVSTKQPILDDTLNNVPGDEPYAAAANRRVEIIIDGATPNYDEIKKQIEAARDAKK